MPIPVIMPKMEMAQETATIVEWLKQEGEHIEKGEPLLAIETDKVSVDVESPATGTLAGVRAKAGDVVPVTETIAYILQPGESLPLAEKTAEAEAEARPPEAFTEGERAEGQKPSPPATSPAPSEPLSTAATPVAQRLAEAYGLDLSSIVGTGHGGRITKADVEAALAAQGGQSPSEAAGKVRATPAARRLARERNVALTAISGSGPHGRIQAADVLAYTAAAQPMQTAAPAPEAQVIPLTGMRRTIAERMTLSYQTAPHITLTMRAAMDAFEVLRAELNHEAEATEGPHVSATALLVKAVAWALRRHPWLNSRLQGEEIHLLSEVNVGVAVALDEGLIVPVVRHADEKGIAAIAAEVHDLATRARQGRLTPADVTEGTFTISNLGPFGVEQFTAIINPPQTAILAVGAIQREPAVDEEGHIVVRRMAHLTLCADHRVVDGAVAARFLVDLRRILEKPSLLLW